MGFRVQGQRRKSTYDTRQGTVIMGSCCAGSAYLYMYINWRARACVCVCVCVRGGEGVCVYGEGVMGFGLETGPKVQCTIFVY